MDADYDESSQITLNENRGKKKSSFSKALHTAKPTFDPGKDIMVFHGFSWFKRFVARTDAMLDARCMSNPKKI